MAVNLDRANTFSLDRSTTFTEYPPITPNKNMVYDLKQDNSITDASYSQMSDDVGIMDEEHVHWQVLSTRVLCFFLLFSIIVCVCLQAISNRFLLLAGLICIVLVFIIICTYVDVTGRLYSCMSNLMNRGKQSNDHTMSYTTARPAVGPSISKDVINPMQV
jgi:regulator of extracellular matrix RemA (YlzA/DUF370 family)